MQIKLIAEKARTANFLSRKINMTNCWFFYKGFTKIAEPVITGWIFSSKLTELKVYLSPIPFKTSLCCAGGEGENRACQPLKQSSEVERGESGKGDKD